MIDKIDSATSGTYLLYSSSIYDETDRGSPDNL